LEAFLLEERRATRIPFGAATLSARDLIRTDAEKPV
jgi:hypothetical protein